MSVQPNPKLREYAALASGAKLSGLQWGGIAAVIVVGLLLVGLTLLGLFMEVPDPGVPDAVPVRAPTGSGQV